MTDRQVWLPLAAGLLVLLVLVAKRRLDHVWRHDKWRVALSWVDDAASRLDSDTRSQLGPLGEDVAALLAARNARLAARRTDLGNGDPDDPGQISLLDDLLRDYRGAHALLYPARGIEEHGAQARRRIADMTTHARETGVGAGDATLSQLAARLARLEVRRGELLTRLEADDPEEAPVTEATALSERYRRLAFEAYEPWARQFPDRAAEGGGLFDAWVEDARARAKASGPAGTGSPTSAERPRPGRHDDDPGSREWIWS